MPRVVFTSHLQRHLAAADCDVSGATVAAALDAVFNAQPQARGYVLDEQGGLRKHVFVFVDGRRAGLADAVRADSAIHVLQALTGG
ncbi:MAG: MoaD/ThiS family protein [Betaproteobacteria bacterium]|nr:MAG: MoaD/ThiS family protein [Betaproteobacteria bacterium]